jgi:hypothetical protein
MERNILEQYKATHKSRNSTSDNKQLYQDYRIFKKIKISLPITIQVRKPRGKKGARVRRGAKVLKQIYYLYKLIQM